MQPTYGCGDRNTVKPRIPACEPKPARREAACPGARPPAPVRQLSIPSGVERKTACNQ